MKNYSDELVQRVNELYHNHFSEEYHHSHPEIFVMEKKRWEDNSRLFFAHERPIKVLDLGTGTGFVPLTTAGLLKKDDIFICSDISENILNAAKKNINKQNFQCRFKYIKIKKQTPFQLPFRKCSIDIITINSVLHHVKDTENLLSEVDRILKPEGLLLVGHEPNRYFHEKRLLWLNYILTSNILNPRILILKIARKLHLEKTVKRINYSLHPEKKELEQKNNRIADAISRTLLKEKLIDKPLSMEEILEITDITAIKGFKSDSLLPGYKILYFETYNHLNNMITVNDNPLVKKYENALKRKYPKNGATFHVVLKKLRSSSNENSNYNRDKTRDHQDVPGNQGM